MTPQVNARLDDLENLIRRCANRDDVFPRLHALNLVVEQQQQLIHRLEQRLAVLEKSVVTR